MLDLKFNYADHLIRFPAGTWCIQGPDSIPGYTILRAANISSNDDLRRLPDLPCPIADWYIESCEQRGLFSVDFTDKNIPIILDLYDAEHPRKDAPKRPVSTPDTTRTARVLTNDD